MCIQLFIIHIKRIFKYSGTYGEKDLDHPSCLDPTFSENVSFESLAGAASSIIFVVTKHIFCHDFFWFVCVTNYVCHNKIFLT